KLHITAQTGKLNVPGTYEVNINYILAGKPHVGRFELVRPASVLDADRPVVITLTGSDDLVKDPLILRETGGRAGLSDLKLVGPAVGRIGNENLIEFPDSYTVPKGGRVLADYTVNTQLFCN